MPQFIIGILLGGMVLAGLGALAWLIAVVYQAANQLRKAIAALERTATVFEKSADMSAALVHLIGVSRKGIASMEAMTAAVQVFTGLVLQSPSQETENEAPFQPTQQDDMGPGWTPGMMPRGPAWKPPSPPFVDEYANLEDAGVLNQTDEEMSEIEAQLESAARGEPTVSDILARQQAEDIRAEV